MTDHNRGAYTPQSDAPLSFDDIHARYVDYRERLRPFVTDTGAEVRGALAAGRRILLEGAHGTMLDEVT